MYKKHFLPSKSRLGKRSVYFKYVYHGVCTTFQKYSPMLVYLFGTNHIVYNLINFYFKFFSFLVFVYFLPCTERKLRSTGSIWTGGPSACNDNEIYLKWI